MKADELQRVRAGFHDPALGSQAVFRVALTALSYPGRVLDMPAVSECPSSGHGPAAMLLQALADGDCTVWLSDALARSDAAAWLRFHTGCRLANSPEQARFLWVAEGDELPPLNTLDAGTDEYPDQSATCVVEVASLAEDDTNGLVLSGPGIATARSLLTCGLPRDFVAQWAANHCRFPRGVDLFLTTPTQIVGLPRTTHIRALAAPQEA